MTPSTGTGGDDDADTGGSEAKLIERCTAVVNRLNRPVQRLLRACTFYGDRRALSLMRLSSGIVREIAEANGRGLPDGERRQYWDLLTESVVRLECRDANGGWDALNAVRRVSLGVLVGDEDARRSAATVMRAEIGNKLDGWRRDAALGVLPGCKADPPPSVDALRRAQAQLDESSANVFRHIDLYSSILSFVLLGLVAALTLLATAVGRGWLPRLDGTALGSVQELIGIMLLGAMGSFLSVALTRVTGGRQRLPELTQGRLVDILRPAVGAASAVAVVLALQSGLGVEIQNDGSKIYVWAVVAGFSERMLRRTLAALSDVAKTAPSPTTQATEGG